MHPVDQSYLTWLLDQTVFEAPLETHKDVLVALFTEEYVPYHRMDVNRLSDGLDLRTEWFELYGHHYDIPNDWYDEPCTYLEMLIALAKRCAFNESSRSVSEWVHILLRNSGLNIKSSEFKTKQSYFYNQLTLLETGERTFFEMPLQDLDAQLWDQMMLYIDWIMPLEEL